MKIRFFHEKFVFRGVFGLRLANAPFFRKNKKNDKKDNTKEYCF